MSQEKVFDTFVSREEFAGNAKLSIAATTNGSQVIMKDGVVAATISKKLQGDNINETAKNISMVVVTFAIPFANAKDAAGRNALPCLMESGSTWATVDI